MALFSVTTWVSRYEKGKTNLDFTEARDSEWQWNPLGYMQVCTSLQTDNHVSTHHSVFYRPDALPATQPNFNLGKISIIRSVIDTLLPSNVQFLTNSLTFQVTLLSP